MNTLERVDAAEVRLVRVPVEPPRGDAIEKFTALELPIVTLRDGGGRTGTGFGYTIGTGGAAIRQLLADVLLPLVIGEDARAHTRVHARLVAAIHALTPGCLSSAAFAAIDIAQVPLRIEDGEAIAWDTPGHGVRFDAAALARHDVTREAA